MSPWASDLWGGVLTTYAESLYPIFYGYIGQSCLTPSPARGPGNWEACSSSVGRGSGCAQAADNGTSYITSGPDPKSFESIDVDKPITAAQSPEAPAKAKKAAGSIILDRQTNAQKVHSGQAFLGPQKTAEPMAEENTPTLMQQPAPQDKSRQVPQQPLTHQQPIMPQKRRLPEQSWEGRHRSKRKRRERRAPQAGASSQKRLLDAEADIPHGKAARRDAETWPHSPHSHASMPAHETGFAMGLQPRKAVNSLKRMKQGDPPSLEEPPVQPPSTPAVSDARHAAAAPQLTWGRCDRRPRKARRPAACVRAASPPAAAEAAAAAVAGSLGHVAADPATPATAAPDEALQAPVASLDTAMESDEELQLLVDAFCAATEPSEAADTAVIFGSMDPEPWEPVTRPLYNTAPRGPPPAPQPDLAPKSDTWPRRNVLAPKKPEWRAASPDEARIFTRLRTEDYAQYLKSLNSKESTLKPLPPFRPKLSRLRFEGRPTNHPATLLAAQ